MKPKRIPAHRNTGKRAATRRPQLRISIVGAGRLGTALGRALTDTGGQVELVVARRLRSARKTATSIGGGVIPLSSSQLTKPGDGPGDGPSDRFARSNLILIATPDDAISQVVEDLANLFGGDRLKKEKRVALHVSGALSSEVLAPLRKSGFSIGSFHPLVSISDPLSGAEAFRGAYFCVEGDRQATRLARAMATKLKGRSFAIDPASKAIYHAAAVTASGHITALFDIAIEMLGTCGLSARRAREVLLPLLESSVRNLSVADPAHALTGTFARGDIATVERHLAGLKSAKLPDALAAYILLGHRSLVIARKKKDNPAFDRIRDLLNNS